MRTCTVPGCNRPHLARGWCNMHYIREYTHGRFIPWSGAPSQLVRVAMPCPLTSGDYAAICRLPTATMQTVHRREAITARERAAWIPDAEYLSAVARWQAEVITETAAD